MELRDLGEHHLKDLDHPERLYQLVAPGLATDFAAPRSLDTETAPPVPVPALQLPTRGRELAEQAVAAVRDLDDLGPSIERQVEDMLRSAGIPEVTPATRPPARAQSRLLLWALPAVAIAIAGAWLLLRAF
jgi:hypothetical protein